MKVTEKVDGQISRFENGWTLSQKFTKVYKVDGSGKSKWLITKTFVNPNGNTSEEGLYEFWYYLDRASQNGSVRLETR